MKVDELLQSRGVKYEDLNPLEKESLSELLLAVESNQLTIEKIKETISGMKHAVEIELTECDEFEYFLFFKRRNWKNVQLKARLKNYLFIEAFLGSPEKAKAALEAALKGVTS